MPFKGLYNSLYVMDNSKRLKTATSSKRTTPPRIFLRKYAKILQVAPNDIIPWHDEKGVLQIGIEQFLLNEAAMEL